MLYFVATPIGNLKDITYRAVEVLNSVDVIACEDTRHSITLLNHYGIKKPLISYHKFNEQKVGGEIIDKLKNGVNIAVVSDAGMPVISDPGNVLVKLLIENNLEYTVIPGATAFASAVVLSGMADNGFCFIGFLPQKNSARTELLEKYKTCPASLIFYSAPHDVVKDIQTLYSVFSNRKAVAVKEITKIHESVEFFQLKDGLTKEPKGEFVLIVEGSTEVDELESVTPEQMIRDLIEQGVDKKEALKITAKKKGIAKSELYKYTIDK